MEIATAAVRARAASIAADAAEGAAPAMEEVFETVPPGEAPMRRRSAARGQVRAVTMSDTDIATVVARLGSTLRFYADRSADAPVTRVLVSGAGAIVDGISDALAASLPMPVQVLGLTGIVETKTAVPPGDDDLNLVTTAGLAMGTVR
jgi:type IV pilus assembly protein PilM